MFVAILIIARVFKNFIYLVIYAYRCRDDSLLHGMLEWNRQVLNHETYSASRFPNVLVAHNCLQYCFRKFSSKFSLIHLLERPACSKFLRCRILQPSLDEQRKAQGSHKFISKLTITNMGATLKSWHPWSMHMIFYLALILSVIYIHMLQCLQILVRSKCAKLYIFSNWCPFVHNHRQHTLCIGVQHVPTIIQHSPPLSSHILCYVSWSYLSLYIVIEFSTSYSSLAHIYYNVYKIE